MNGICMKAGCGGRQWSAAILAVIACSTAAGEPSISSVSGSVRHDETVTVSGSGFGAKPSAAAPRVWDNFEGGVDGEVIHGRKPIIGPNWDSYTSNGFLPLYSNASNRHNSALCSRHDFVSDGQYNCSLEYHSAEGRAYFTFWWKYTRQQDYYNRNTKPWIVYGDSGWGPLAYIGFGNPDYGDGVVRNSVQDEGGGAAPTIWGETQLDDIDGEWVRVEVYLEESTPNASNGTFQTWIHKPGGSPAAITFDCNSGEQSYMTRSSSNHWFQWHFGSYFSRDTLPSGGGQVANGYICLDDFYFDVSRARVELGNASTWSACTHREIQIPTNWNSDSITITVNQGAFQPGQTVYLYVVDENGNVNENGYPVTIDGGSSGGVVFASGFEEGNKDIWDDYDGNPDTENQIIPDPGPLGLASNHVMRFRVPAGERGGADLVKVLPDTYDRLYARWYIKYEEGFNFDAPNHGGGLFAGNRNYLGMSGTAPEGDDWFQAVVDYHPGSSHVPEHTPYCYTYYAGMYMDNNGPGSTWGDSFPCVYGTNYPCEPQHKPIGPLPNLEAGRWYCVEVMMDAGTPTPTRDGANGTMELWLDDVSLGRWDDLWFRSTPDLKLSILWLSLFHHDGTHSVAGVLYDEVVVSTQKIGPLGAGQPDNDGDGIPDDVDPDDDNDGMSDVDEAIAGTDPKDENSKPETRDVALGVGGFHLSFGSVSGRLYDVLYKDDLFDPTWLMLVNDVAGDGSVMEVLDSEGVRRRFYRIRVRLP